MAVPKKKISSSRRGKRRSHHALSDSIVMECPNCGAEKRPHHVCPSCGYYNSKQVVELKKAEEHHMADAYHSAMMSMFRAETKQKQP